MSLEMSLSHHRRKIHRYHRLLAIHVVPQQHHLDPNGPQVAWRRKAQLMMVTARPSANPSPDPNNPGNYAVGVTRRRWDDAIPEVGIAKPTMRGILQTPQSSYPDLFDNS